MEKRWYLCGMFAMAVVVVSTTVTGCAGTARVATEFVEESTDTTARDDCRKLVYPAGDYDQCMARVNSGRAAWQSQYQQHDKISMEGLSETVSLPSAE